jgi:DNA segregation ATPase FtsK/SpoIIIE, S-DNA-T family
MFENRNLKSDLIALLLSVLTILFGAALLTYQPGDVAVEAHQALSSLYLPDVVIFPPNNTVGNACGRWGALTADLLLNLLGCGAYYLVVSMAVLDFFLLRRYEIDTPVVRAVGWMASLVGITALAALVAPRLSPGPVIGAGGYLGALGKGLLSMHFATAGSILLAVTLSVGGLLLCTDYLLINVAVAFLTLVFTGTNKFGELLPARPKLSVRFWQRRRRDDLDGPPPDAVAIKFRGKPESVDSRDLADDDADWEAEDAEEAGPPVKRRRKADESQGPPSMRFREPSDGQEREEVRDQLDQASRQDEPYEYELPGLDLLLPGNDCCYAEQEKEVRRKAKILEKTFLDFGFKIKVVEIETGPVIAQYEVELEAGLRLSKITGLADDLAIALRVPSVRIVAPIPGKNTVGIEIPNEQRQVVRLREVMEEANGKTKKMRIPIFLGKDVSGSPLVVDLSTLPHLLIAGRTGTGKSVCLNAIITSILMTRRPDEVRLLMVDPKMVELSGYGRLPHLMHPVVTDMRKAEAILAWAVDKMEERYALLARAGVRHISSYNQLDEDELMRRLQPETEEDRAAIPLHLPFIVMVADEIADLMMTAGKEVEQHIIRLAQKSRAVGIHLILATQKPTVDVITGLIKSNLPARISFQVASRTDSRVVLDEMGADKLLGNGDMLFLWPGTSTLLRGQGTYLDDDEIDRVVEFVSSNGEQNFVHELVNIKVETKGDENPAGGELKKRDDLYEAAVDIVVREGRGSVSLLQRILGIGYGRAARLIDYMAEDGVVGAYNGSQAREILITLADWERMQGGGGDGQTSAGPPPSRKGRVVSLRDAPEPPEGPDGFYDDAEPQDDEYEPLPTRVTR